MSVMVAQQHLDDRDNLPMPKGATHEPTPSPRYPVVASSPRSCIVD
jgi:hypothetical protein